MISILSLFECIARSSSLSLGEKKLIAIATWIFYESDFLRLYIISFKYGLNYSRYSLLIGLCVYHYHFCMQYNCCSKNYLFLLMSLFTLALICLVFLVSNYFVDLLPHVFFLLESLFASKNVIIESLTLFKVFLICS